MFSVVYFIWRDCRRDVFSVLTPILLCNWSHQIIKVSKSLYSAIEKDSRVKIGCELEFAVDYETYYKNDDLFFDENIIKTYKRIAFDLEKIIGSSVKYSADLIKNKKFDSWYVERDGSIDGGIGVEIVSPPLTISEFKSIIPKVLSYAKSKKFKTNESTGFHLNISVEGVEKIDFFKLVLFSGLDNLSFKYQRASWSRTSRTELTISCFLFIKKAYNGSVSLIGTPGT